MKQFYSKSLKVFLWIIAGLLSLVILLIILINFSFVQNIIKNQIVGYLKNKTKTEISLEKVRIAFPNDISLNKLYVADLKKDTLLYADKLNVNLNLFALIFSNKVEIKDLELSTVTANIKRVNPDTTFNFSFLVDAFMNEQEKPEEKVKKDSSSTLKFAVDQVSFNQINIRYRDDVAGNDVSFRLGSLNTKIKSFDLDNQHYVIKSLAIKNTALNYLQQKPLVELAQHIVNSVDSTQKQTGKLPTIEFEALDLNKVNINYNDELTVTRLKTLVDTLGFTNLKVDLTHSKYTADKAFLNNSNIGFAFKPAPANNLSKLKDTVYKQPSPLLVTVKQIDLKNNAFKFDNVAAKAASSGIDFNHLDVNKLFLGATDLQYNATATKVNVKYGSLTDKSGFKLDQLSGDAVYSDKQIKLSGLILKTPHTRIENTTEVNYSSLDDFSKHPQKVKVNLRLKNTIIGLKDAAYFSNAIPKNYINEKIKVNGRVNGYLGNLAIPELQISGLKNTQIDISGHAKGLPDINKTFLDLDIKRLNLTKRDLLVVIPKKSLPKNIELPDVIHAKGKFNGSISNFNTRFDIRTDMGNAKLIAKLGGRKDHETYAADVDLLNFNVGRLIKQSQTIGRITTRAQVRGQYFDPKKIDATFKAQVLAASYNKYTYKNLILSGSYKKQNISVKGAMTDSNANFNLDVDANLASKYPSVKGLINLKQIDLQKLNFSKTPLKIAGNINANIKTADVDFLNGDIFATKLQLVKDNQRYALDTIQISATSTSTNNKLSIKSEILAANVEGKYELSKLGNAFINQINKYYQFGETTKIGPQSVKFNVNIYYPKFIKDFVPELTAFTPAQLNGFLDTQKDSLILNAFFPKIVYGSFTIDTIKFNTSNENEKLNYKLNVNHIQSPSIQLFNTELSGNVANNDLGINLFLRDRQRKDKYALSGLLQAVNKDFKFNLIPDRLILDYEKWTVSPDNYIQFGKAGILAHAFNISRNGEMLSINSTSDQLNSPVNVEFKNFKIETLTKFAETDSTLVGGTINGLVNVKELTGNPKFEADLTINKLRYLKDELGNLNLKVNNATENAFEINAGLKGVHELSASGFYYTAPKSSLDLKVNVSKIDLQQIESLSMGQIKQGKGTLSGAFSIKGEPTAPQILGSLKFNDASFRVAYVNSFFRVPNQEIKFDTEGVHFNRFNLLDSLGQAAVIDGTIYTADFKNIKFGIDARTNNFRLINSTVQDNNMIYGTLYLTSTIKVRGTMNSPDVNMNLKINKGTKFFYALPVSDPSVIDQEGIVQFIDEDAPPFNGEKSLKVDSISQSSFKGMNLVADISIDPEAELSVVVDPANGDMLTAKGTADLNATIDPSGKISMTGKYEVEDGSYNLSVIPLNKKTFKLVKGSTITWTGEPTEANVNLTALYEVSAAPIDLLNQPSNATAKTKMPFQVYLYIKGELLKPIITFKIDLPEDERSSDVGTLAYAKLQVINRDENELNKQVFALLALNRFIADNPFQSLAGGTSVSSMARSSVSKLLSDQLNNLASDLIQGVDINFDLNSTDDYSSGALEHKTDLEVALSKKLFDDRLTVTVGSSFALEGSNTSNQNAANIAGNVNVEYALSRDGRYRLRAYRRNQTEAVIEGQIIETGLGFTMVVDYNKFREIFQKRRNRVRNETEQKPKN